MCKDTCANTSINLAAVPECFRRDLARAVLKSLRYTMEHDPHAEERFQAWLKERRLKEAAEQAGN